MAPVSTLKSYERSRFMMQLDIHAFSCQNRNQIIKLYRRRQFEFLHNFMNNLHLKSEIQEEIIDILQQLFPEIER